jgi:DNA-directed RNA polymerase specialized sigma24 family protein
MPSAWLYGVAARVARQAQATQARQQPSGTVPLADVPDPRPDPLAQVSARDLLTTLEEAVQRLPEAYRLPIILCCIEGLSQEEAAQRLGWPLGLVNPASTNQAAASRADSCRPRSTKQHRQ